MVVGGRAGRGTGQETAAVSAALPYFDCLIDAARHYVGSSLVEICKRGKHLFGCIKDVSSSVFSQLQHRLMLDV